MTDAQEREQIDTGLRGIRSRHRLLAGILVTYLPVIVLLYLMRLPEWLVIGAAVVWVCAGIFVAFTIGFTRCPACSNYFHVRGMGGNVFVRACMHCGIRLSPQE